MAQRRNPRANGQGQRRRSRRSWRNSPPNSSGAARRGKRVLQAIGGNEARSDMTTKRLAELDAHDHQLEQRMAELRDELAAIQRESVSTAQIQRAVALFDPVWDMLLVPERSASCTCS
jgi:hypothetical protein